MGAIISFSMKTFKSTSILVITLLSIWLLSGFAPAADATAAVASTEPLDNQKLTELRDLLVKLEKIDEKLIHIKGTEVKVRVTIHIRADKSAYCTVIPPKDVDREWTCRAELIRQKDFSDLKNGEEYLLEGTIATDSLSFAPFTISVNKLDKAEQAGADQPATTSESKSDGNQKPQPESKPAPR